jgi:hypothetical protein
MRTQLKVKVKMRLLASPYMSVRPLICPNVTTREWHGLLWNLILVSFTNICLNLTILVKIVHHKRALYIEMYKRLCSWKWLGGESPGYLGHRGYQGNLQSAAQLCGNMFHDETSPSEADAHHVSKGHWPKKTLASLAPFGKVYGENVANASELLCYACTS